MARIAQYSRLRFAPAVGVALALVLSGCAAGQISQTADQVAAIDGANGDAGALGVRDVLFATTETGGYPAGSDLPIKLWLSNSGTSADVLSSVSSPNAGSVEISTGTTDVQGESLTQITPETDVTITLMGLTEDLPYGHSIPLVFTFANAGTVQINVAIEIPAERDDTSRETVNILPAHPEDIWFGEEEHGEGGAESTGEGH